MGIRIVIPTKNEANYIRKLLSSIKNQTYKDYEIVVADAFSTDNTRKIALSYGCKVINGGPTDIAKNKGVKGSKKSLICFIDADVILPNKEFLEDAINEFEEKKLDAGGVIHRYIKTKNKIRDFTYLIISSLTGYAILNNSKGKKPFMQAFCIVKKKVHDKVGGFPPLEFCEDAEYVRNIVKKGYKYEILLPKSKIFLSPRRFENKGMFKMLLKYFYFHILYKFGYDFTRGKSKEIYFD